MAKTNNKENSVEDRTKILLDESNRLFNNLWGDISNLRSITHSFFQMLLVLLTLELTSVGIIFKWSNFSEISYFFLIEFLILMCFCIILSLKTIYPKKYFTNEIFEKKRWKRMTHVSKRDLLSDLLYHTKMHYEMCLKNYESEMKFYKSIYLVLTVSIAFYILLVISILL